MPFAHGHALVIGVGSYQHHTDLNVPITVADAQAVADALQNPSIGGYPASQVTVLHDADATLAGVEAALQALATATTAEDTVILFYAGHGGDGTDCHYYLSTHDTRLDATRFVAETGLSLPALLQLLAALPVKRALLIFNACHSGAVSGALDIGPPAAVGASLSPQDQDALLGTGEGRIVITACRRTQRSYIGRGPLTIFTTALVAALNGEDVTPRNGYIGAYDLYEAVYEMVQTAMPQQEPELTIRQGVGPFPVALYRGATSLGTFQSPARLPATAAARAVDGVTAARRFKRLVASITTTQIDTGGGDYAKGNIDKRSGIHGGTFNGPAIGTNSGTVSFAGDHITAGNISNSTGVALGKEIQQHINQGGSHNIDARKSQGFINRPDGPVNQVFGEQRNIDARGGTYYEHYDDNREGTFVSGNKYEFSGQFNNAIFNIESTLKDTSLTINSSANGTQASRDEVQSLIAQLSAELKKVPPERAADAEAVADMAKDTVEEAAKPQPKKYKIESNAEGLKKAAENIRDVLPTVVGIAAKIAMAVKTFM